MAKGQPPAFRFKAVVKGEQHLVEIGQAWKTAKPGVFSVTLDPVGTGEPIKCMMFPNEPKPPNKTAAEPKPAA